MAKILILFAHPAFETSRVQKSLIGKVSGIPGITIHDLYETYPDFDINIKKEQELLLNHDIIIWQHPFYWYSSPPVLKQWIDLVLEHGWAYGSNGMALLGKYIFNCISTGGPGHVYQTGGENRFTIRELLSPFDQTAYLCRMIYLPPFVIHGAFRLSNAELDEYAEKYAGLLTSMRDDPNQLQQLQEESYLNEALAILKLKSP